MKQLKDIRSDDEFNEYVLQTMSKDKRTRRALAKAKIGDTKDFIELKEEYNHKALEELGKLIGVTTPSFEEIKHLSDLEKRIRLIEVNKHQPDILFYAKKYLDKKYTENANSIDEVLDAMLKEHKQTKEDE
jgi:hypothetical protein